MDVTRFGGFAALSPFLYVFTAFTYFLLVMIILFVTCQTTDLPYVDAALHLYMTDIHKDRDIDF